MNDSTNLGNQRATAPALVAALEHMTGVARGTTRWIVADEVAVVLAGRRRLETVIIPSIDQAKDLSDNQVDNQAEATNANAVARIHHRDGEYILEVKPGFSIWVNGALTQSQALKQGDVVEFGDDGPLTRLRLFQEGGRSTADVGNIFVDTAAYLRRSRKPLAIRLSRGLATMFRRLVTETSFLFRGAVLVAILLLAFFGYRQDRDRLERQIASGEARIEGFATALKRSHQAALRPGDLRELQREVQNRIPSANERLSDLKERNQAGPRMYAASRSSVAFLQGAYGFRETKTGRMLRHAVDTDGKSLTNFSGQPVLTLDGNGPVGERQFTGTGFWITKERVLVTNRHVALPWEEDASANSMAEQGLLPVPVRFIAYFPGIERAENVTLLRASDRGDLALLSLRPDFDASSVSGLRLANGPADPGSEVIVLGYPTGLRALVAQTGTAFIKDLQDGKTLGFWAVAVKLSKAGFITPLASRGIVGRVTTSAVVYDADTTHGGSGGPVLNSDGEVVAVNMAILPDYGGSNLGLPIAELTALLAKTDPS